MTDSHDTNETAGREDSVAGRIGADVRIRAGFHACQLEPTGEWFFPLVASELARWSHAHATSTPTHLAYGIGVCIGED